MLSCLFLAFIGLPLPALCYVEYDKPKIEGCGDDVKCLSGVGADVLLGIKDEGFKNLMQFVIALLGKDGDGNILVVQRGASDSAWSDISPAPKPKDCDDWWAVIWKWLLELLKEGKA